MINIEWQTHTRVQLLQHLINMHNYQHYLEIGCDKDQVFGNITVALKEGVDPNRGGTQRMTSDAFFEQDTRTWDLIFIDGLHTYEQVSRDCHSTRLRTRGTLQAAVRARNVTAWKGGNSHDADQYARSRGAGNNWEARGVSE